jgi:hypothetical protein
MYVFNSDYGTFTSSESDTFESAVNQYIEHTGIERRTFDISFVNGLIRILRVTT